jgi:recombination protein RecR
MPSLPAPIDALTSALSRLPGIGPRSAERIALYVVQADARAIEDLARTLIEARTRVAACRNCGALTEQQPCAICSDPKRDGALVCIVERPVDIFSIEKSGTYRGRYHVLGGKISPLGGIGPEDLRIAPLEARIAQEGIQELIIALPSDVEGDATSYYLNQLFASRGVRVTRIAQGLPVGSGLEFADGLTLSRAIDGRRALEP